MGQTKSEAKLNSLQNQQIWDMMRARQAEMLQEAQREHLAAMAQKAEQPRADWLKAFFRRSQAQSPAFVLEPSATPELG